MRLLVWNNGAVVEASQFSLDRPYVMQRIHTLNYKVLSIARHVALLRDDSIKLFGFASLCSADDAERIICKLLELSRVAPHLSTPVAMRLTSDGALSFEVELPTYNSGIYLRAKRYTGVDITMTPPETVSQTSVTVATESMVDVVAEKRGGEYAIWSDAEANVISLPWRPMFAVYNNIVYTPCEYNSVEYMIVVKAINALNLELIVRTIPVASLERMEEVFFVDVMTVYSLSMVKQHRLLSVVTARIANKMGLLNK